MLDIFSDVSVAGIPLLVFVLGLVQWVKGYGLRGEIVRALSLGIGTLLGIGYQFSTVPPVDFTGWFTAVVFGLSLGLVASGVYDAVQPKPQALG